MQHTLTGVSDAALIQRVLSHYYTTAPLIEASLSGTPIVYKSYPRGIDKDGAFTVTETPLTATKLLYYIHAKFAIEYYTWAPLPSDDDRLQYARILLTPPDDAVGFDRVKLAALAVRAMLFNETKLEAVPLIDGGHGMALWIPLADAPHAKPLREWLHGFINRVAANHPDLVSTEVNTHHDGRVHLHVSSNAAAHYSSVPYGLRAQGLTVCTPIAWEELGGLTSAHTFSSEDFKERLQAHGDVFATQVAIIKHQRFAVATNADNGSTIMPTTPAPRGHIINAAIEILDDGKPRTADEILAEALKQQLVPPQTTKKYVYSALIEYIARQLGRGRKPPIVQDAQRRFCINEPPDDWPTIVSPPQHEDDAAATALATRLEQTATGDDPAAFEAAVCDAFAHLGFLTQHLGGHAEPDGIADAILGTLGYRVMLECKTAKSIVPKPDVAEAAKFRDAYHADLCTIVGPAFAEETELLSELQLHKVTALTVPDLQTLLHISANAYELQQRILVPGYASDVIGDLLWERNHGEAKRVATVAALIAEEAWKAQVTAATQGGRSNAPDVTIDAAMLLVDEALQTAGSTQACRREEVEEAFAYLTSPNVARAVKSHDDALVIVSR